MTNEELLAWALKHFELFDGDIDKQIPLAQIMATCFHTQALSKPNF